MSARTRTLASLAAMAGLALAGTAGTAAAHASPSAGSAAVPSPSGDDGVKVMLVLDASGSMNGPDPSGLTRLAAAQQALAAALPSLPADAEVGLRVYGATVPGDVPTPEACADTQLVHPLGPLDIPGMTASINSFQAVGETPIAYALEQAAVDLGDEGKRHVILVSDGEERCNPDPCAAVAAIVGQGIDLQIDTVGFGVNDTARSQLQCIADAGNGTYYDAADANALSSTLTTLSTRTARPFTVTGTPVVGTDAEAGAPMLAATDQTGTPPFLGQFTDAMTSSTTEDTHRYYTIERTVPGSDLRVNLLARLPASGGFEGIQQGFWNLELRTPEGAQCDSLFQTGGDLSGLGVVVSSTLTSHSVDPTAPSVMSAREECAAAEQLILQVTRLAGELEVPAELELRVMEEPPVAGVDGLPGWTADTSGATLTLPPAGEPTVVVGGASFNDALEIGPGYYETELVSGEIAFFALPIGWGQRGAFALDGVSEAVPLVSLLESAQSVELDGTVYGPDFALVEGGTTFLLINKLLGELYSTGAGSGVEIPEVRYLNRWVSGQQPDLAGHYYVAVGAVTSAEVLQGVPLPVRFVVNVEGEVAGVPEYAEAAAPVAPTEDPTPEAAVTAEESPSAAPVTPTPEDLMPPVDARGGVPTEFLVAAGAGALALVAALAIVLVRRGRKDR